MELQEIKMEVYRRGVELNPNSRPDDLMDVAGSFAEFFKHMDPVMQEQVDKHGMQIVPPVCRGLIRMGTHVLSQSDEVDAKGTDKALDLLDILVTASIVALGTIRTAEAAQKLMDDGEVVEVKGNEEIEYDGEVHTAANLYDALKEGYYGKF